jgi:hypothetical protein
MRQLIFFILLAIAPVVSGQEPAKSVGMTQQHLHDLILEVGSDVLISGNIVQFSFGGADLLCISDIAADRMRIISPIVELTTVDREQLLLALMANFHSALDARYAISDGVVYSAYIHPLSPLSDEEVIAAISQVASARNTFGEEYSSGELYFGGGKTQ